MFRGLLVPVDAPDDFDSVRPAVESLAAVFAAEVLLLHVLDPQEAAADRLMRSYEGPRSYDGPLDSIPTDYRAEAEDGLNELAAGLRDAGLTVSTQVIEGHPAPVIGAAAGERRGTLVIIATHARTGVARWVLGSVTDKVLRSADDPVLVLHMRRGGEAPWPKRLRTVLLPLDGSAASETACPYALGLAGAFGASVTLLHAVSPTADEALAIGAEQYMRDKASELQAEGPIVLDGKVLHAAPEAAILQEASLSAGRIIVMARHGRSGLGRWVLGSATDRIVRHSPVPVLVVPPQPAS